LMGIPLHAGRYFNETDRVGELTSGDFVVDEVFASTLFPDDAVVGEEMSLSQRAKDGRPWNRILGVVGGAQFTGLDSQDGIPVLYKPYRGSKANSFTLLIRTDRLESSLLREVKNKLHVLDSKLVFHDASSLAGVLADLLVNRRGVMSLLIVFATVAVLLSAIGLYGLLAYDVQQRRKEIGIRAAIGADKSDILRLILRQGLWKTVIGLLIGVIGSLYLSRFLESRLFDIAALDPWTYLTTFGLLLGIAAISSYLPARRAMQVDPLDALRAE